MALRAAGSRTGRIKAVCFDANEQLVADLRNGVIDALILQDPFRMGYESVRALGRKLKGEQGAAEIDSGVRLVKREDLDLPEIRSLLQPDLAQWLKR